MVDQVATAPCTDLIQVRYLLLSKAGVASAPPSGQSSKANSAMRMAHKIEAVFDEVCIVK